VSYTARGIFRLYFIKKMHSSVRGCLKDNKFGFGVDGLDEGEPRGEGMVPLVFYGARRAATITVALLVGRGELSRGPG
jgi:hypothetical protein